MPGDRNDADFEDAYRRLWLAIYDKTHLPTGMIRAMATGFATAFGLTAEEEFHLVERLTRDTAHLNEQRMQNFVVGRRPTGPDDAWPPVGSMHDATGTYRRTQ